MVGLAFAFTPMVGAQMPIVAAIWFIVHRFFPRWDFNLLPALAWTWVTNVFSAPIAYYLFLVTGRAMLGRFDNEGFDSFQSSVAATNEEVGWLESLWVGTVNLFDQFGVPMFVGCIPWAILMGWAGYWFSLKLIIRTRRRRDARRKVSPEDATPAQQDANDSA